MKTIQRSSGIQIVRKGCCNSCRFSSRNNSPCRKDETSQREAHWSRGRGLSIAWHRPCCLKVHPSKAPRLLWLWWSEGYPHFQLKAGVIRWSSRKVASLSFKGATRMDRAVALFASGIVLEEIYGRLRRPMYHLKLVKEWYCLPLNWCSNGSLN